MGKYSQGILGAFSGLVGPVVGSNWKGKNILRSKPKQNKNRKFTAAQRDQQLKFAVAGRFVLAMQELVADSFKERAKQKTAQNDALSYTLKNAITGASPDFAIDYALALVSRGGLPNAKNPAAAKQGTEIKFTWTDNSGIGTAKATDIAVLVAYCEDLNQMLFLPNGIERSAATGMLDTTLFVGHAVQAWLCFKKAEGFEYANSFFCGELLM